MKKDPDHNSTDSAEIEALITRLERGQLRDEKASGAKRRGELNAVENFPPHSDSDGGKARDHAARAVGVSGKSIDDAGDVQVVSEDRMLAATGLEIRRSI